MIELLIIADDLTGAIDTGVQLAKQGISTSVIIEPQLNVKQTISANDAQVLVFNTESRHINPKEAAQRIKKVVSCSKTAGIKRFYKKTDSTMRGNIGSELEAFLIETGKRSVPFIPAHPKLKRFTRNGFHFLENELLHETAFGHDPLEPIKTSYIPELLHQQTAIPLHLIDTHKFQDIPEEPGIIVFDCDSEKDLKKIGKLLFSHELDSAISGSAAMAELLPDLLKLKPKASDRIVPKNPSIIINGSLNKISFEQVNYAGDYGINVVTIPEELFAETNLENNQQLNDLIAQIRNKIHRGQSVILNSTHLDNLENSTRQMNTKTNNHGMVSRQIGLIVAKILSSVHIKAMVVIGGDTLMGIMKAIGCKSIAPKSEILSGVALSLACKNDEIIQVITKPGGYGEKDVILQLLRI